MRFENITKENAITPMESKTTERELGIRQFLTENLPQTEERIREPMNPRCEVCIVLPAYSERKYILRPLASLAKQEGVDPDQYEVIVVVNNPPNTPEKSETETEDEYRKRVELYNDAVENNQETLKLIGYINGEDVPIVLTEQEKEAVATIKKSGLHLFVIDKTSEGKTLSKDEANVGGARNRGIAEAIERFHEHVRKNGILVHSDAEVRFSDKYVQDIIRIFQEDPELIGVTNTVAHESAEDTDEIFRTISVYAEMQEEYDELSHFLYGANTVAFVKSVDFDGSNMASRAFETALVNGIPKIPGAEDTYFGWRLAGIGKVKEGHEPITTTMDRLSSRTTTGRGLKTIRYQEMIKEKGTIYVKNPEYANIEQRLKEAFFQAIESGNIMADDLKKILQINDRSILSEDELRLLSNTLSNARKQTPQASPTEILSTLLESKDQEISHFLNSITIRSRIDAMEQDIPIEVGVSKLLKILSADGELQKRYVSIRGKMIEKENQEISNRNKILDSLCNIVFVKKDQGVLDQPLVDVIRQYKTELEISDQQLQSLDARNPMVSALSEIVSSSRTKQEALNRARDTFQHILSPLEQNNRYLKLVELRAMREAVKEIDSPENEFLKERLREILSVFNSNKEKADHLTTIVSKNLNDELLGQLGLNFTVQEIKRSLEACVVIENPERFLSAVSHIASPIINAIDNHPEFSIEMQRRTEAAFQAFMFTPINEILSYGVGGDNAHIHLADISNLSHAERVTLAHDGLEKLAVIVKNNPRIKTISATSWLVHRHPRLMQKFGFKIEGLISEEMRQKYFKGEKRPISSSAMSREEFLIKYLKE